MNNFDTTKINSLLDDVNNERNKLFNEVKQENDKYKTQKLKCLQNISTQLLLFKSVLDKEKEKNF